ncbi:hypothetical protein Tco_0458857 [Tanacetum coccineum]
MDLQSLTIWLEEMKIKKRNSEQWTHHMLLPQNLHVSVQMVGNSRSGRVQYSSKPSHRILDMVIGKLIAYDDARSIFKTMEQCNHTNRYDDARSIFKTMEQCNANTKICSHQQEVLYARSDL